MKARTVLLVEDDEELRHLYKEIFHRNGFKVYEAGDGQLGVEMAIMNQPDAIILDLMLPRQGGLAALRVLRSLPESRRLPIFILTALPNPEYKDTAKGRVQGFFLKTEIKPQELVQAVLAQLG